MAKKDGKKGGFDGYKKGEEGESHLQTPVAFVIAIKLFTVQTFGQAGGPELRYGYALPYCNVQILLTFSYS